MATSLALLPGPAKLSGAAGSIRVVSDISTDISKVQFSDGWSVRLRATFCQATYAGHLEGPITSRRNDAFIRKMCAKANDLFGPKPVHLIEPERVIGRVIEGYEFVEGEPVRRETLPAVCCIGDFEGDAVPGQDGCASGLIVVWFQPAPPPVPIEPQIVDMFFRIPWDDLAVSYWY
jgi:hypothetical protein